MTVARRRQLGIIRRLISEKRDCVWAAGTKQRSTQTCSVISSNRINPNDQISLQHIFFRLIVERNRFEHERIIPHRHRRRERTQRDAVRQDRASAARAPRAPPIALRVYSATPARTINANRTRTIHNLTKGEQSIVVRLASRSAVRCWSSWSSSSSSTQCRLA